MHRISKTFIAACLVVGLSFVSLGVSEAATPTNSLKLKINAKCTNGVAFFRVVNNGDAWPKAAQFEVYRAADNKLLKRRRLRMAQGQNASFRIRGEAEPGEELAIYIDPAWYERDFRYDGKIVCR